MIKERLKDLDIKITELAGYLSISRPTMYKFIDMYDAENKKDLSNFICELFDYIDTNELIDKKNVINYILSKVVITDDTSSDGNVRLIKEMGDCINRGNNSSKKDVIRYLSKYCVIPKYGFPVDVVDLQIYENGVPKKNKYDMNRDLKVAISEYAPDSEVIVDGKKYTSKYIALRKGEQFPKNWFVTCPGCKKINVFLSRSDNTVCKYCGEPISMETVEYYIEPANGFKSGETKESTRLKPKRSYSTFLFG